jgi:lactate dehydrogenase-like 2-hydroxyacid dehydrogenase
LVQSGISIIKSYYGTGGDLNVDEIHEVIPWQKNVVYGIRKKELMVTSNLLADKINRIGQLRQGVVKVIENPKFSRRVQKIYYCRHDRLRCCWSGRHYYETYGGDVKGKKAIVQGFGNVGSAAAFYLAEMVQKLSV